MSNVQNIESLLKKLDRIDRSVVPNAAAAAINRTARTVRTRTGRDIADAAGLKVGTVKRRIALSKRATKQSLFAVLRIKGRPLNLIHYKARPSTPDVWQRQRRGVLASPYGKRRRFLGAFVARMPNGSVLVVKQSAAGRAGKRIQSGRWAGKSPHIEAMYGPGIANEAATDALRVQREQVVKERLPIELKRELRFRVSKELVR